MEKNKLNTDKTDASPERNNINRQQKLTKFAFIFGVIMAVGIIAILVIAMRMTKSGDVARVDVPLTIAIAVTVAGGAMMALFTVLSLKDLIKESRREGAETQANVRYTVDPSVLKEPLIKQLPEVQRLLQYESVQKAFFDGKFPSSSKELADPHLQELISVLSQLADEDGVIRL